MAAGNQVVVTFAGDTKSLEGAFKKLGSQSKGLGTTMGSAFKIGAAVAIAQKALTGLIDVAKIGWDEFQNGQKVTAQTAAALKSTGGAANVTAKQIQDLGTTLMKKSGIDDEVIRSNANMLLTFTGVRNEVGKGNDIFTQATKTVLDMSVALKQDGKSSAIQLGKALNDPIKGITALQRVGVSFTAGQMKSIKAMVASGHTMQAQKTILKELNKEFGGSAAALGKTLPGKINIAKEELKNLAGDIVGKVAPVLASLIQWFVNSAVPVLTNVANAVLPSLENAFNKIVAVAKVVGGAISSVVGWFKEHQAATEVLKVAVLALLAAFAGFKIVSSITSAMQALRDAQIALNVAMDANPIGLIVAALAAVGVALYEAWQHSATFRDIVKGAFDVVKTVAQDVADFFTKKIPAAFEAVLSWLRGNWQSIATIISGPFAPLVALATNAFGIRSAIVNAFTAITHWIGDRIGDIVGFVTALPGKIAGAVSGMWDALSGGLSAAVGVIRSALSPIISIVDGIRSTIEWIIGNMPGQHPSINAAQGMPGTPKRDITKTGVVPPSGTQTTKELVPGKQQSNEYGGSISSIGPDIVSGIRQAAPQIRAALSAAVTSAITSAKQNLTSIGSSLSGLIGQAIDATAAAKLKALGSSTQQKQLDDLTKTIQARQNAEQKASLEDAIANAQTDQDKKQAQQALDDWLLQQQADTLSASLTAQQQAIQDEATSRKDAAAQGLADLTDNLNRGLISQATFNNQLQALLAASGVNYGNLGTLLGSSFANAFSDQLAGLRQQMVAILSGPTAPGGGAAPSVVSPSQAQALDAAKSVAAMAKTAADSFNFTIPKFASGGVVDKPTIALIGEAGPEAIVPLSGRGRARAGGGTTINVTNHIHALDPHAAATAVIRAVSIYEQRNGKRWVRA